MQRNWRRLGKISCNLVVHHKLVIGCFKNIYCKVDQLLYRLSLMQLMKHFRYQLKRYLEICQENFSHLLHVCVRGERGAAVYVCESL